MAFDKLRGGQLTIQLRILSFRDKVQGQAQRIFEKIHIPTYLKRSAPSQEIYWRAQYMGLPRRFSADLSVGAVSGQTVTFENIQLAVHLA